MVHKNSSILAAERIIREVIEKEGEIKYPIDPFALLKKKTVRITFSDFDKLEGLLLFDKESSVVSININRPVTRQRFTAAHELGHSIMHVNIENDINFLCPIAGKKSIIEKEADEFASNLLMPTDELAAQVNLYQDKHGRVDLDQCLPIAEYFGVSFEACVWSIYIRLNRLKKKYNLDNIKKEIRKYKPAKKRQDLFYNSSDLKFLQNMIEYSLFTIPNISNIVGIRFIQNLIYHDSRLEGINLSKEEINEIYADFRLNGNNSKYCTEDNRNIIEVLGNIEMNKYCFETNDNVDVNKMIKLNKLFCRYFPYPEYGGIIRTEDNIIKGGKIQPVSFQEIPNAMKEINTLIGNLIRNKKESVSDIIEDISIIHYKMTVLHPFGDGNGRMARAFMNWLLRIKNIGPLYIDSENRDAYLDALGEIDINKDTTKLQILVIKSIIKTMAELHDSWR